MLAQAKAKNENGTRTALAIEKKGHPHFKVIRVKYIQWFMEKSGCPFCSQVGNAGLDFRDTIVYRFACIGHPII